MWVVYLGCGCCFEVIYLYVGCACRDRNDLYYDVHVVCCLVLLVCLCCLVFGPFFPPPLFLFLFLFWSSLNVYAS